MKKQTKSPIVVVLVTSFLVSGCTSLSTNGPLELGGNPGQICAPVPQKGLRTFGEIITNKGDEEIVLQNVSVVGAEAVSAEGTYVIPMKDTTAIGTASTIPDSELAEYWETRREPASVKLSPGEYANVVVALSLQDGAPKGTADAIRVTYSSTGVDYAAQSSTEILLTRGAC